jgi:hypothetical protein
METVEIGGLTVSQLIIGGNPFSGFSHQSREADARMRAWFTDAKIKETLSEAEANGINTFIGRLDDHITGVMTSYWEEGGEVQWFAQTCPELGPPEVSVERARDAGAQACYIHGGVMDFLFAQDRLGEVPPVIDLIHKYGMLAGIAGHNHRVQRWAEESGLPVDFYMCSYYNPTPRDENAEHVHGAEEVYDEADRRAMTETIQTLSKPVIHYKIMAAGRHDPAAAFDYAASKMRPGDVVCVGMYTQDVPDMIAQNVDLLEKSLSALKVV